MFNLLKSDLYRMVHTRLFWGFTIAVVAVLLAVAGVMAWVSSEGFIHLMEDSMAKVANDPTLSVEEVQEAQADMQEGIAELGSLAARQLESLTSMWGNVFLGGGFLGLIGSMFIGIYLVRDFRSGFVKGLPMNRRGRRNYYLEKMLLVVLVQGFYLLLCAGCSTAFMAMFGFSYLEANSAGDILLVLALTWLLYSAYGLLTACVAWLVRNEGGVVAWAVVVSSGMAGAFITQLMLLLAKALPFLEKMTAWTLSFQVGSLAHGAQGLLGPSDALPFAAVTPAGQAALVGLLFAAVAVALAMAVLRKRDIK